MNNNNNNNIDIFDYKTFNNKNYNFKQLICNKLKINVNELRIDSLDDISKVASLICNDIPISNLMVLEKGSIKTFTVDDIVETIDIGGTCYHVNILFGLLLFEFNIECKLVSKPIESNLTLKLLGFNFHCANIIKWKDGKMYYFDIGSGLYTCLVPIDIDKGAPVVPLFDNLPKCYYRIIKKEINNNTTYIFQKQLINEDKGYINIFDFDLNRELSIQEFNETFTLYYNYLKGFITLIKVTNNGIYSYYNNNFTWMTSKFKKEIIIKNRQQAESIFKKYYNININDYRFLDHYDYN